VVVAGVVVALVVPGSDVVVVPDPVLVSLIVTTGSLVASTVPLVLPDRIDAVNVSSPSVVESINADTEKDPRLPVIANEPEPRVRSLAFESIVK
jgi:hypothetical protein